MSDQKPPHPITAQGPAASAETPLLRVERHIRELKAEPPGRWAGLSESRKLGFFAQRPENYIMVNNH